jgi:hypothetical protein
MSFTAKPLPAASNSASFSVYCGFGRFVDLTHLTEKRCDLVSRCQLEMAPV